MGETPIASLQFLPGSVHLEPTVWPVVGVLAFAMSHMAVSRIVGPAGVSDLSRNGHLNTLR